MDSAWLAIEARERGEGEILFRVLEEMLDGMLRGAGIVTLC